MIDVHSHLLPFIDDGSRSVEKSIEMVKTARKQGVTHLFLTPHFRSPYFYNKETLIDSFNEFKNRVESENIDINLYLGQEIRINKTGKERLQNGELITLNDTNYLLVEFSLAHRENREDVADVVFELKQSGYSPIVAHFERYAFADLQTAVNIKRVDGLVQINAESVLGKNGFACKRLVFSMISQGLVDFIGSDMHDNRKYLMEKAYKKISKKFGEDIANDLFINNAKNLIKG